MSAYYSAKRTPSSVTATTEAAGYPAGNAALESIARPWRGTSVAAHDVIFNYAASAPVMAVLLEDVNFAACEVRVFIGSYGAPATLTTYADKLTGRRRGIAIINNAGAITAVKLTIPAGTATDGLAYWRIGAAYVFQLGATLPADKGPLLPMRMRAIYPMVSVELPNKQLAQARTGAEIIMLSLSFKREYLEDGLAMLRAARAGTIGLDLAFSDYPELALPMNFAGAEQEETFSSYRASDYTLELREST